MKKKVISAALAGTLAVSLLSACGASNEPQNISDVSSAASSEATSTTASSESTGDAAQELTFVLNNIPRRPGSERDQQLLRTVCSDQLLRRPCYL